MDDRQPLCGPAAFFRHWGRVLNSTQAPVAPLQATPHPLRLDAFVSAAASGRLLWVTLVAGEPELCSGATPADAVSDQVGRFFVAALREHFGEAASAIAEREWRLGLKPRRLLPARTVRRAVACAESALSLLMAQSSFLLFEFSAVLGGWRFRRVAESLGLDPATLSVERRQALDQALHAEFGVPPVDAEVVTARLRAWLTQAMH